MGKDGQPFDANGNGAKESWIDVVVGRVRRTRIWAQYTADGGTEGEKLCSLEVSDAQKEVLGARKWPFLQGYQRGLLLVVAELGRDSGDYPLPWISARGGIMLCLRISRNSS
uniref:Uncharacterized protein n=1 Tax=Ananas comosus var. bracteatus TaxID=296719 RepID=A0A6V7PLI2_ANACO|nr:unnamed protein product [Ananas comosus var. bracteatus]